MARAFEGIRVIDFTTTIAGPHCSRLLADLGPAQRLSVRWSQDATSNGNGLGVDAKQLLWLKAQPGSVVVDVAVVVVEGVVAVDDVLDPYVAGLMTFVRPGVLAGHLGRPVVQPLREILTVDPVTGKFYVHPASDDMPVLLGGQAVGGAGFGVLPAHLFKGRCCVLTAF